MDQVHEDAVELIGDRFRFLPMEDPTAMEGGAAAVDLQMIAGLQKAGFQLLATLVPAPKASDRSANLEAEVRVKVDPGEASILLVQNDAGVLAWQFPTKVRTKASDISTTSFDFYTLSKYTYGPSFLSDIFSIVATLPIGPVSRWELVYVLRFVAHQSVSDAVAHIENLVQPGPVLLNARGDGWASGSVDIDTLAAKIEPLREAAGLRVLLLVHGVLSSTFETFHALAGSELMRDYDLVLGWDHRTLSDDPVANAREIFAMLVALDLPATTVIDAVAYSRGGLVYRVLVEGLAADTPLGAMFNKAVFVGCANGGTLLAKRDNWFALLNVYTNLMTSAVRAGPGLAGAEYAEDLALAAIRTMGSFAQLLSEPALSESDLPGLAAMAPDGPLVQLLNTKTLPADFYTRYFVIGSKFVVPTENSGPVASSTLEALSKFTGLLHGHLDGDLVVTTNSMLAINAGQRIEKGALVPSHHGVYHTVYFDSPFVVAALARWLAITPIEDTVDLLPAPDVSQSQQFSEWSEFFARTMQRLNLPAASPERVTNELGSPLSSQQIPSGLEPREGNAALSLPDIDRGGPVGERRIEGLGAELPAAPSIREGAAGINYDRGAVAGESLPPQDLINETTAVYSPSAEALPQDTTERFIAAEMSLHPTAGKPVNIYVTVSPDRIVLTPGDTSVELEEPVTLARRHDLIVEVIPTLNCELVGTGTQTVSLQHDEEEVLKFSVRGLTAGSGEVLVVARQGSQSLATFTLSPVFVASMQTRLSARATINPIAAVAKGRMVLRIYEFKSTLSGLSLLFNLTSDDPAVAELQAPPINAAFSLEGYTADVIRRVEDAWNLSKDGSTQDVYKSFLRRLRTEAKSRTDSLIPDIIRRRLWSHRKEIKEIQVISNEPLIPWELMYLSDPDGREESGECFFAELALTHWLHDAPLNRQRIKPEDGGRFCVIPEYTDPSEALAGASSEREMLEKQLGEFEALHPTSNDVCEFLRSDKAKNCAILHFACHGRSQQNIVVSSELFMLPQVKGSGQKVADTLTWYDVHAYADFGSSGGPLVFVNACQTGRQGSGISGPAGFASAFLRPASRRGAAAFIGALWSVDDQLASLFAASVYEGLAAGKSLGAAVAEAREVCKTNNDFTWLAYSVYASL